MRIQWEALPPELRDDLEAGLGAVIKAEPRHGGAMPGVAARLWHEDGTSTWLKACPRDHDAAWLYERERRAGLILPRDAPAPRMRWSSTDHGWVAMAHVFVNGAPADLSPGSDDVAMALATIARLGELLTPCPQGATPVAAHLSNLLAKAHAMLDDDDALPGRDRAMYRDVLDGFDPAGLVGGTLLHFELHPGALRLVAGNMLVLDWGLACQGPAWVEPVLFAPWLIFAGHSPRRTESLLADLAVWQAAPPDPVTRLIALWTMFRFHKAAHAPASARAGWEHAARSGRAWLKLRLAG
ncbi:hypothetical protein [Spongiactinospora sp. 9N601]|uniref:hypothetical protein n=1 Tax=Spongiactinospora sp. 9N601 TaxID=3375149 RepID=UPI0037AE8992